MTMMNRDSWAAIVASIAVVVVIILGFRVLGSPGTRRLVQADVHTVRTLAELAQRIKQKWSNSGHVLPANLDEFADSEKKDPVHYRPFVYHPGSNSKFELCTTFVTDNRELQEQPPDAHWAHPKGDYCFPLDASQQVPQAPYQY
jgi:hypothetical protein